jgi:DNA-binding NarL/FixJ family response regulator
MPSFYEDVTMEDKQLLLVEDHYLSAEALKGRLMNKGWEVTVATYDMDAYYRIEEASKAGFSFDFFAIDLGLKPLVDQPEKGLNLALNLRGRFEDHPILAYTSQSPRVFDYALVLKQLLAGRISFVYLRPGEEGIVFEDMVDITHAGNLIISSTAARYLSLAIASVPDPLRNNYWKALKLLNEGKNFAQVGTDLGVSREAIQHWVNEIREVLAPLILENEEQEEKQTFERIQLDDLKTWYKINRVRYCRD